MDLLFFSAGLNILLNSTLTGILIGLIMILILCRHYKETLAYLVTQKRLKQLSATLPGYAPFHGYRILLGTNRHKLFLKLAEVREALKADTFKLWLGPMLKTIHTDPRDFKIIMESPQAQYKSIVYKIAESVLGRSTLTNNETSYRPRKKVFVSTANGIQTLTEFTKVFNVKAKKMIDKLGKEVTTEPFNAEHYISPCMTDIVFETVYGVTSNCLDGDRNAFIDYMSRVLFITIERIGSPWLWPDVIFYRTARGKEAKKLVKAMRKCAEDLLVEKKKMVSKLITKANGEKPTMTNLIEEMVYQTLTLNIWSNEELEIDVMMLYAAVHDATEGIGCFAALMLAMFPEVQEKARDEVKKVVGNRDITEADANNLKYLEMVIKETVRLFPVAPIMGRELTEDLKLATCTLPKGAHAILLVYATHRDPSYWSEPDKFIPERFTPENLIGREPWAYVGFGGGDRRCAGMKWGMTCLKVLLGHLIWNYQLSTTKTLATLDLRAHISVSSTDGYPISLTKINH